MRRHLCLGLALVGSLAAGSARAASCCGGASIGSPFVLPYWERAGVGALLSWSQDRFVIGTGGERYPWRADNLRLLVGGARRLVQPLQVVGDLPLVVRGVVGGVGTTWGADLGDATAALRWSLLEEETCILRPVTAITWFDLKPTIQLEVRGALPTSRLGTVRDPTGADLADGGAWRVGLGLEVLKVWGRWGNSLAAGVEYAWATPPPLALAARWRFDGALGLLYFFAWKRSLAVTLAEQRVVYRDGGTTVRRSADAALAWTFGSWRWQIRAGLGYAGLWGSRATTAGPRATLGLVHWL